MHILLLTENFPPEMNAAATRVYERACYWIKWGHKVTVVTCAPNFPQGKVYDGYQNRWYQTEMMDGIRVVRVKSYIAPNAGVIRRILDFLSFMAMGFVGGLFQRKPDVIVGNSPQFFTAVAAWALSVVKWKPFVFELADLWPASISGVGAMKPGLGLRLLEKLELFLYRRAKAVVALTQAFKDDLTRRGIPADKIAVVMNGVDLSRYEPREKDRELAKEWGLDGKFVAGYIGTHGMAHALDNILAAAEFTRGNDNIRFMLVGAGACRDALVDDCQKRGLTNVVMVPPQPKERMPAFWSLCDVALIHLKQIPLFETVLPSKMFEAMGMGIPLLLAMPKGEASAIVEKENAGVCVPGQDPQALAQAVENLQRDQQRYQTLKRNSSGAAPRYSRERQATDMIRVLDNVWVGNPPLSIPEPEPEPARKLDGGSSVASVSARGRVLVTGATGFIGRHVCKALLEDGFSVRAIAHNPLKSHLIPEGCEIRVLERDMDAEMEWSGTLDGVTAVVHLAAQVHRLKGESNLLAGYRRVNAEGTRHLADCAVRAGVKRFVLMSTVKVSGETTPDEPFRESAAPRPEDPYGVSKLEAEQAVAEVCRASGGKMDWVALRPPLVYGPGVKANFLRLLTLVDKGIPIPLGAVTNLRSFIGVRNLTDAVMCCLKHPAASGEVFLVCDGQDQSTSGLIRRMGELEGRRARLVPIPLAFLRLLGACLGKSKEVDRLVGSLVIDLGKIDERLGWRPPFTMDEELAHVVRWYRARWFRGRKKYRGAGA